MQTVGGREPLHGDLGRFYDAIENPRRTRGELPILRDAELRAYLADVRERTLDVLDGLAGELGPDAEDPLLRDGFVYEMLLAHELQHNETMLQLLQMVDGYEPVRDDLRPVAGARSGGARRCSPSPPASTRSAPPPDGFAYDNERGRHTVELGAFEIDRTPVSNAAYARFVEETGAELPMYWERDGEGGSDAMGATGRPGHPSSTSPGTRPTPSPAGPASGCRPSRSGRPRASELEERRARAWEWTSSDFLAYPGFEAFPYPEYSQVFFGDAHKVLRGGSWATHPSVMRPSFRNWDLPERRQIFSGIRCARDA